MSRKNRQKRIKEQRVWMPFEKMVPLSRLEARKVIVDSKAIDAQETRTGVKLSDEDREALINKQIDELLNCTTYVNNLYTVARYEPVHHVGDVGIIHLSFKRNDRQPITSWSDVQRIKNEVVGPEHEACELFPAESRLVNLANQYHLWVLDHPEARFPFGFDDGRNVMGQVEGSTTKQTLQETT